MAPGVPQAQLTELSRSLLDERDPGTEGPGVHCTRWPQLGEGVPRGLPSSPQLHLSTPPLPPLLPPPPKRLKPPSSSGECVINAGRMGGRVPGSYSWRCPHSGMCPEVTLRSQAVSGGRENEPLAGILLGQRVGRQVGKPTHPLLPASGSSALSTSRLKVSTFMSQINLGQGTLASRSPATRPPLSPLT